MSFIDDLRKDFPEFEAASDEQLISILPRLEPEKFAGLTPEQLNYAATTNDSQFIKGLKAGADQVQALAGGALGMLGDATDARDLKTWGLETYQDNIQEAQQHHGNVDGFTDIEGVEDAFDWATYTLGNLVPTMVATAGAGVVGGSLAKMGGKKLLEDVIQKEMAKGVTREVAAKTAGAELAKRVAAGNAAGAFAGSAGMEMGSIYGETEDAGVSAVHGVVAGAFDAMPIARVLNKFGLAKEAKEQVARSVKGEIAKQAGFEGGTEALQTLTEQHAKYWVESNGDSLLANLGEVNVKEIIDATAAGAIGGSVIGGAVGLVSPKPMQDAQGKVEQAKQQAADAGGDALDQAVVGGQAQSQLTPEAVAAQKQMAVESSRLQDDINTEIATMQAEHQKRIKDASAFDTVMSDVDQAIESTDMQKPREGSDQVLDDSIGIKAPDETGKGHDNLGTTHGKPTPTRQAVGAETFASSIDQELFDAQSVVQKQQIDSSEPVASPSNDQEVLASPVFMRSPEIQIPEGYSPAAETARAVRAARRVVAEHTDVHHAVFRPDIGEVDFIWGDEGKPPSASGKRKGAKGIAHIIEARMRKDRLSEEQAIQVVDDVARVVATGEVYGAVEVAGTSNVKITDGKHTATLVKPKGSNAWLLSGWENREVTETSDGQSEIYDSTEPTHQGTTRARPEVGAEASPLSIEQKREEDKDDSDVALTRSVTRPVFVETVPSNLKSHSRLTVDAVRSVSEVTGRRLRLRGVKLNTVATEADLPPTILKQAEEDGAQGQIGAVYHDGAIHVVADRMHSVAEVETAIFHEIAHYGGRALFGKDMVKAYNKLWMKIGGQKRMQALAEDAGLGDTMKPYFQTADRAIQIGSLSIQNRNAYLVDEFVAHLNQQQALEKLPQRVLRAIKEFIGAIRDVLRKNGFAELPQLSDTDLAYLLKKVNKAAQGHAEASDRPHFMRVTNEDQMDIELNNLADELEVEEQVAMSRKEEQSEKADQVEAPTPKATEKVEADSTLEEQPMFSRAATAEAFNDLNDHQTSLLNKIGPKTPVEKVKDRISDAMENIGLKTRQGMVDRYASLLELDKKAQGDDVVENRTKFSSWVLSKMSHAADGALASMLSHGRIRFSEGVVELQEGDSKGLLDTLQKLGSNAEIERFMGWIAANRSNSIIAKADAAREKVEQAKTEKTNLQDMLKEPELSKLKIRQINKAIKDADKVIAQEQGKADIDERLFTREEVEAGITLNEGKTEKGKNRKLLYRKVFKEFQEYRDDVLAIAEESGIITSENRSMWSEEFYVPFYRVMEDEGIKGPQISKGLSRQEAYKRLKGGDQDLNDLLENTLMNFQHLISASLKNNAARQALNNAEQVGIAHQTTEAQRSKNASTYIMDDGEKVWFNIEDDLVFQSLTALTDVGANSFSRKIMRSFKRTFTSFTTISPQFIVANTLRDSMQAIAIGNMSYNAFKNVYQGAKAYGGPNGKSKTRADMLASGASFSFGHIYGAGDIDALKEEMARQVKKGRIIESPKDAAGMMRKAWDYYTGLGDTAENANRAAIYQQNLDKGKLYAAFQARDLMDFSSQGTWPAIKFLADVVPFFNARLIGLDRLYRGGVKPTFNVIRHMMGGKEAKMTDRQAAQRFAIVVGAMTAASIALYMSNKDDERFKELEEWERDSYWHYWIGDDHFKLPKPFEVGAIATIAERSLEQLVDSSKDSKLFAERMSHILTDTFAFNPIPQAAKPLFDLYSNKDSFTGRDIESMAQRRLSPELRVQSNTTDGAKYASAALGATLGKISKDLVASPVQVDFLIQGYFGWLGSIGAATVDIISKEAKGVEAPYKHWHEYQPIRRFYKDDTIPKSYTRYSTEFYNHLREVNMLYADINHLRKVGEMESAAEAIKENGSKLRYRQLLNRTQRTMSKLNTQIKLIRMNKGLPGAEKRRRIEVLTLQRNALTKKVMELIQ